MVIEALRMIALGEFIPFHWLTDPIEEKLEMADDQKIFSNMGAFFVVIILFSLLTLTIVMLLRCFRRSSKIKAIVLRLRRKLFWNSLIRTIITGYLKLSFAALASVAVMSWSDAGQSINSLISLVILIGMCQYPLSFGYLLHKKRKDLPKEETKQKYGSLYLGMRTETWL